MPPEKRQAIIAALVDRGTSLDVALRFGCSTRTIHHIRRELIGTGQLAALHPPAKLPLAKFGAAGMYEGTT